MYVKCIGVGVIEWMNCNQGFLMALLTLAYVIATVVMAWLMLRSNGIAMRSLAHAVVLEDRRSRPYLVFDLEFTDKCVFAVLKNIGLSPALKIKIILDPVLQRENIHNKTFEEIGMTKFPPSQFGPGQYHRDFIDIGPEFFKRYGGGILHGKLSYFDMSVKKYEESFVVDLAFFFGLQDIGRPDIGKELVRIGNMIEKVANRK
jgi:hypothetical protein